MKILAYGTKDSGCTWHRLTLPLGFMSGVKSHLTNYFTPEILSKEDWDIFIYNRICPFDKDWGEFRKQTGMKVVMDIDDWWVLPPSHINYQSYKEMQPRIENNLRDADLVTVTHSRLAEKVYPFNKNIEVLPNALPFGLNQYKDNRPQSDKIRIFWAGGISHVNDIELLRQPMKRIKALSGIQSVIGGYNATNEHSKYVWDKMVSAFTCGRQIDPVILESVGVDRYMDHFNYADIMLVPLEGAQWHSYKSNLKLLEAGSKRLPVIVSKVHPYIEGNPPVFYVERQSGWFTGVKALLDPELRQAQGNALHDWAVKNFHIDTVNEKRKQCFQILLKRSISTGTTTKAT